MQNKIIFLVILFLIIWPLKQVKAESVESEAIKEAFEKALQNIEKGKEKEQQELVTELKLKLNSAVEAWIAQAKKDKSLKIDMFIEQGWEKLPGWISSAHYDYYLKDFTYQITKTDIIKTDSLITPYKAVVNLDEKLYAERSHAPSVSFREKFFYTVTRPLTISLEYDGDKFTVINTEYKDPSIEPGWPEEVKLKIILR